MTVSLVLASGSAARAKMLRDAGVTLEIIKPAVDEDELKASYRAEGADVIDTAIALAEMKAQAVSRKQDGRYVLGADQMLECEGVWFDKPADIAAARAQLKALRGRKHHLISAAVLVKDGQRLWHHVDRAELTMRDVSDEFLEWYLALAGDAVTASVGAYHLEGLGAQLMTRVRGDFFTVLGLPLLPVLAILRSHGMLRA
ncbi:Maf family protein [Dongia rigui]|uniref:Nucleoside triphosphate pyrophosphatase n=1 Tax=Dongia rigui TaxID=940149 RepID=A0ABU5DXX1_9PROT|nr:nucleoside triphosphate pyrophosphatase [Dongia rigui]MDY0872171.1 nucleoside triphosphate pyrophosphatase [Dongia rigui]